MASSQDRRSEVSWALYDWANSAFATTVLAALFPVLFKQYWSAEAQVTISTFRLGAANSLASLLIVLLAPVLGAIAGAGGLRKRLLLLFAGVGAGATGALWLVPHGGWFPALVLFVVGSVGFMGANVCYDALLVDVASPSRRHFVSALGYALGYLGGGLLFAVNVAMVLAPRGFGLSDATTAARVAFVSVAVWWAVFTVPLAMFVREQRAQVAYGAAVRGGVARLRKTIAQIRRLPAVWGFLFAYFLYIDGVDTIIKMAVDYGQAIGLDSSALIGSLLITQFVGFPATLVFGRLGPRLGVKRAVQLALVVYVAVTVMAASMSSVRGFYMLAAAVGLVQGGVQALSRSLYSQIIPRGQAAEFFGVYNMLGKSAAVLGPLLLGLVSWATGEPRLSTLVILVLLLAGGGLLSRVNEVQGARAAEALDRASTGAS
jgi:UMF1 family MFS transporter